MDFRISCDPESYAVIPMGDLVSFGTIVVTKSIFRFPSNFLLLCSLTFKENLKITAQKMALAKNAKVDLARNS